MRYDAGVDLALTHFSPICVKHPPPRRPLFTTDWRSRASRKKDLAWEFIALMSSDNILLDIQHSGLFCGRTDMLQRMSMSIQRIDLWYNSLNTGIRHSSAAQHVSAG